MPVATTSSLWKARLDETKNLAQAEALVDQAIREGDREELLLFLRELYEEFIGPDSSLGGHCGTKQRIQKLARVVHLADKDITSWGVNPLDFRAIVHHA